MKMETKLYLKYSLNCLNWHLQELDYPATFASVIMI